MEKHRGALQWLDDTLLYGRNMKEYLNCLQSFLIAVQNVGIRLNLRKCDLSATTIEWCGRVLRKGEWTYHPKYFDKILQIRRPVMAHELAKAVYICGWLGPVIPKLSHLRERFKNEVSLQVGNLK